ncbi:MAG: MFS transporter [Paludibacteraceae bacterium]|jgi:MFS family permease|nr:MFS transporter [Paludibacteraceae bacterium]
MSLDLIKKNDTVVSSSLVDTKHHARYALLTIYFFSGFVFATLFSRMPALRDIYHLDYAQMGLLPFCMSIGSLVCMPFCANLANKYGSNRLTEMGYVVAMLFILLPIMPSVYLLYPLCMIYGAVASIYDIAINGNSILVENSYKRAILSKFHAIYYVGTSLGALFSILFISFHVSLPVHFSVASIFVFCELSVVRPFLLKERPKRQAAAEPFHLLFPKGLLLLLAFVALFSRVIEGGLNNWSTTYMNSVISLPQNLAPVGLAVYAAFMAVGRFFGDIIRNRYSSPFIIMVCAMCTVVGLGVMIMSTTVALSMSGLLFCGLGMSCLVPVIYSMGGSQADVSPGTGIAMINTVSGTGFFFGPYIIGLIGNWKGLRMSFMYVLLLGCAMLFLSFLLWNKSGRTKRID